VDTSRAKAVALAGATLGRAAIPAAWVAALPAAAVRRAAELSEKLGRRSSSPSVQWRADIATVAEGGGDDRLWVDLEPAGGWVVVADGAGGMSHGAAAAELLVTEARTTRPTSGRAAMRMLEAVDRALASRGGGLTTAVVLHLDGGRVVGASVGDSQAWALGSFGCEELTEHQARRPLLGSGRATPVPFVRSRVDRVVVATDGLGTFLPPVERQVLLEGGASARAFVDAVRLPGGTLRDDTTVVVAARA